MENIVRMSFERGQPLDIYDLSNTYHHLGFLADDHPDHTPQLLLQIGRHQQEENPQGRGF